MYGITYKMIIKMALSLLLVVAIIVASVVLFAMMANEIYGCDEATQNAAKIEPTEVIAEEPVNHIVPEVSTESSTGLSTESTTEPVVEEPELEYIPFDCTAYCPCVSCSGEYGSKTSTGTIATAGRTIAVDPTFIPYGTEVIIEGMDGTYLAEDCGGLIKGKNRIDIFFDSHEEARAFGRRTLNVAVIG